MSTTLKATCPHASGAGPMGRAVIILKATRPHAREACYTASGVLVREIEEFFNPWGVLMYL